MLVLSRKCSEGIVIGEGDGLQCDCRIVVLSIRGGRVTLGIEADPRTTVRRAEVLDRKHLDALLGHSIEASDTRSGIVAEPRPQIMGSGAD